MPERLKEYNTICSENLKESEQIINKSRFISRVYRIKSQEEADEIIARVKKEHYKATHVCSAWILATNPLTLKASDDGEPSGTAGRPILDVIEKKGLHDVLVLVIRYFGGIKLGSGGLVRAYSSSARDVLDANESVRIEEDDIIDIEIEYGLYQGLKLKLKEHDIFPVEEEFSELVRLRFNIPVEKSKAFEDLIRDYTNDSYLLENVKTDLVERKLDEKEYKL